MDNGVFSIINREMPAVATLMNIREKKVCKLSCISYASEYGFPQYSWRKLLVFGIKVTTLDAVNTRERMLILKGRKYR